MEEKDEFQRNLYIQALLGGIALTLSLTTVWGNLEDFVHVPHLDLIWVYPLFWIFVLVAFPVVWLRYRDEKPAAGAAGGTGVVAGRFGEEARGVSSVGERD